MRCNSVRFDLSLFKQSFICINGSPYQFFFLPKPQKHEPVVFYLFARFHLMVCKIIVQIKGHISFLDLLFYFTVNDIHLHCILIIHIFIILHIPIDGIHKAVCKYGHPLELQQWTLMLHITGRCYIVTFGESCVLFSYLNFEILRPLPHVQKSLMCTECKSTVHHQITSMFVARYKVFKCLSPQD